MKTLNFFLISILVIFFSCKKSNNPVEPGDGGNNNKIQIGEIVDIKTQTIATTGGIIKIDKPGDKLDGFEITIPPNSFTENKSFKISYAEIKSHQFGQYFNPVSPLIKISYEGGYSDQPMKVKVPIKLPKGHFAMGFFFDEKTGKVEGLPIEELDSNHITISTRHFSSANSGLLKINGTSDALSIGEMIISSVSESVLKSQVVIASGYLPGIDDWEFVNYGSYIAPGGHCAGQSMTSMWYYYEKKLKGEQALFHKYDVICTKNNPGGLWQDNPLGYRFASTIQEDFNFDGWVESIEFKKNIPGLTFNAFAASILITGEPQFVLIRNSAGQGGHAMVVYKVNYNEGKLYIADPNYPNNINPSTRNESIRTIDYVNGQLKPYETGLTAGANSTTMDEIGYFAKTAYIEWEKIGKRWIEMENQTIGDDKFPQYSLHINGSDGPELHDGIESEYDELRVVCKSDSCNQWLSGTDHLQSLIVYDEKGYLLSEGDDAGFGMTSVKLKRGENLLSYYICGRKNNNDFYVDFMWTTVKYYGWSLKISPEYLDGVANKEYTFTALTNGNLPTKYKFVWGFNDGTPEVSKTSDSTVTHTFTKDGKYTIHVALYNNETNELLKSATAEVNIAPSLISEILSTKAVTIYLRADMKSSSDYYGVGPLSIPGECRYYGFYLTWTGLSFSVSYNYKVPSLSDTVIYSGSTSGTLSEDGKTITTLTSNYRKEAKVGGGWLEYKIQLKDLPFTSIAGINNDVINYKVEGSGAQNNVVSVEIRNRLFNDYTQLWEIVTLQSIDYFNTSYSPLLYVKLEK